MLDSIVELPLFVALVGEVGLSYLVETDDHRILFDVGHNARAESPSPLEHNMGELGIGLASIDTVFISHNHLDHVGGMRRQQERSFSIGNEQAPLSHPAIRSVGGAVLFLPVEALSLLARKLLRARHANAAIARLNAVSDALSQAPSFVVQTVMYPVTHLDEMCAARAAASSGGRR